MSLEICLGTAQFGLDYGITNNKGRVKEEEVRKILHLAIEKGIYKIDTAQAYGKAEKIIGRNWPKKTKISITSKGAHGTDPKNWDKLLKESMKKLGVSKINNYLIHNILEIKGRHGEELISWLKLVKRLGMIEKIGVSIYDEKDLDDIPEELIEVIQLPLSIYDQRFIRNGIIKKLDKRGVEINVRSIFMQGLILREPEQWPSFMNQQFKQHHQKMWLGEQKMLETSINFIQQQNEISGCVIGVLSKNELSQIIGIWEKKNEGKYICNDEWYWKNYEDIDQRKWPK